MAQFLSSRLYIKLFPSYSTFFRGLISGIVGTAINNAGFVNNAIAQGREGAWQEPEILINAVNDSLKVLDTLVNHLSLLLPLEKCPLVSTSAEDLQEAYVTMLQEMEAEYDLHTVKCISFVVTKSLYFWSHFNTPSFSVCLKTSESFPTCEVLSAFL